MKKRKSSGYEAPPAYERELPVRPVVAPKAPSASWQKIPNRGPVPVARPAEFIQLTPIVQPIPLVPYLRCTTIPHTTITEFTTTIIDLRPSFGRQCGVFALCRLFVLQTFDSFFHKIF